MTAFKNTSDPPLQTAAAFHVDDVRKDFPALQQLIYGKPLIYLDNAATTQKPRAFLEALQGAYIETCANVQRGVHWLSSKATQAYEATREKVRQFIHAADACEIIFVRGTTEAINLVASSYGRTHVHAGDEVLITAMEHHSNIVPWQLLCQERGALLKVVPINRTGEICLDAYAKLLNSRTKLVAFCHISNALGTINPVEAMVHMASNRGIPVCIDGAQAAPHQAIDVQAIGCDFYAFSAHKMFGPTGVGVLYGKTHLLENMPPYQGGGDMIEKVTFAKTTFNKLPYKFEAGTPNIADVIAFGSVLDYLSSLDLQGARAHEDNLMRYGTDILQKLPGVTLIGTSKQKAGVVSFVIEGIHPHDIGTFLDHEGIAIRTGHHCAQPVMHYFGVPATVRVSVAFYNTFAELDALLAGLKKVQRMFAVHG